MLGNGYKPSLGCVDVRFDHSSGDRRLGDHEVKLVDGQCKILTMLAIVGFCVELEFGEKELEDQHLRMVLASFVAIRCSFRFFENESDHFLYSLRSLNILVYTFSFTTKNQ